jgi:hypothetical protein
MSNLCPQCNGLCDQHGQCPACRTRFFSSGPAPTPALTAQGEAWQDTAVGRLFVGVLLAQGLAYGLRLLCNAGLLVTVEEVPLDVWATLTGLILLQGLQGVGLLVGGALASAGQARGVLLGSAVGLVNGFLSLVLQRLNGEPVTEVLLYGQPILHLAFGTLGGLVGSLIWSPLPPLTLATPPGQAGAKDQAARPHPLWAAPVAWRRVVLGTVIVVAGVFWPKVILGVVLDASQGKMSLSTHLQAELVTWEVSALIVILGAGLAGATACSGFKQGLFVGVGAILFLAAAQVGGHSQGMEHTVLSLLGIVTLSVVGGWFGGQLFPPLQGGRRRRSLRASLSKVDA